MNIRHSVWAPRAALGIAAWCLVPLIGCDSRRAVVVDGSEVAVNDDEEICLNCFELREALRLGDVSGPGFLQGEIASIGRLRSGAFVIPHGEELKVFDSAGAFLRTVGAVGAGPGEYKWASLVLVDMHGQVHVFDALNARHTVLDSTFALLKTNSLPGPVRWVVAKPDSEELVVNMPLFTEEHIGYPVHVVNAENFEVLGSLGMVGEQVVDMGSLARRMAVGQGGRIAVVPIMGHAVEIWDRAGRLLRTLSWGDGENPAPPRGPLSLDTPPPPLNASVRFDSDGRLWIVRWVPRPDWAEHLVTRRRASGQEILQPAEGNNSMYSTEIDVLDATTGARLATGRYEAPVYGFLSDGVAHGIGYSSEGAPQIVIWSMEGGHLSK